MKIIYSFATVLTCFSVAQSSAQDFYTATSGETIFSMGDVDADTVHLENVLRFSPVFNFQQQFHYDFSNVVGIYTGLGVRNVGLITHTDEGYKIKERSYSLGIPLALKLGNMEKQMNVALGAEAEIMFAWKRKIVAGEQKTKYHDWFSDQVNIFNPSVFMEFKFYKGAYIRFKYYLDDFLNYDNTKNLAIPTIPTATFIPEYGKSSPLFYVSIGTVAIKQDLEMPGMESEQAHGTQDGFFRTTTSRK